MIMQDNIFFTALYGSQNYHLETGLSDIDTKTLVIPTIKDLIENKVISETVEIENGLNDRKDLRKMFEQFLKQNPSYLEILASREVKVNPLYQEEYDELISMTDEIIKYNPKDFFWATYGTMLQKRKDMLEEKPITKNNIEKYGYDGKNASHILRLASFYKIIKSGKSLKYSLDARHYWNYNTILALKLHQIEKDKAILEVEKVLSETELMKNENFTDKNKETKDKLNKLAEKIIKKSIKLEYSN